MKRRNLILSGLGLTGALVVGWGVMPPRSRLGKPDNMLLTEGDVALNGWIKITKDGGVVLAMHRSDMGQGIHNALAMLVAEELDVPLKQVRLEQAGHDAIYGNVAMFVGTLPFHPLKSEGPDKPMMVKTGEWMVSKVARELGVNATGGSSSVKDAWEHLRTAAATAKASLLLSAADQWKVPAKELSVKDGVVNHASGKSAHYGEFAKGAAGQTPGNVVLKDRKDWRLIGQAAPRADVPAKTNGSAVFGIDVRVPNMLFASIVQVPQMGGTLSSFDAKEALAMPGVVKCVQLASAAGSAEGFAVVAKTTWHAKQAAEKVKAQWAQRAEGALDTKRIESELKDKLKTEKGFAFYEKGDAAKAESVSARMIEAQYKAPYLAHATMEPMNCTAQFKDGSLEIWAPTQVPGLARATAAKLAKVSDDKVKVNVTLLGGGFGRRLEADVVAQATQIALALDGAPVQLVWSREEDMAHDFYRPMHVAQLSAALNAKGEVESLRIKSAGDAISPRWMSRVLPALSGPIDAPDKTTAEGLFDLPYGFANQHMAHVSTKMGVPIGFWRSVGHSHNAFFTESFIDELAFETKQDPVAFRLALLQQAPRYAAVLKLAAEKAKWGTALPVGHAHGVALHESFGSIVAQVAEVSIKDGVPRVHRVVCAIDCGTVVNPGTVKQQVESSVNFALSAALFGKIDIQEGVVQQTNFTHYPLVSLAQSPVVETWIVPSTRSPEGVGEPAVPPLAPAVANAMFKLSGQRMRALPLLV
ncbi:xanthine dehydrogenase family protein molybdopterin-binding subunit [Limnohabitans sp. 103DPR2]|uniref:xanthine dehydrogenase family protein molybdopterin-binding subunit n=1 Tax=Limnohabitans sp. 103DPR2 TaxID=1678129 RepID=UPI0006DD2FC8|nr:molybdopterin cofactor-binding domain-containing protein [Limnohabitans sp. 103DPR2]ALK91256.1 Isoquinoline 1-oxidoreductase subunit beta [Limnohabitans sp. 103DPR2]